MIFERVPEFKWGFRVHQPLSGRPVSQICAATEKTSLLEISGLGWIPLVSPWLSILWGRGVVHTNFQQKLRGPPQCPTSRLRKKRCVAQMSHKTSLSKCSRSFNSSHTRRVRPFLQTKFWCPIVTRPKRGAWCFDPPKVSPIDRTCSNTLAAPTLRRREVPAPGVEKQP